MDNWPYKYFSKTEMQCKCGCKGLPKPELMEKLEELRILVGVVLPVSSGFRCSKQNMKVSDSGIDGPHTRGLAADLSVSGPEAFRVLKRALELGFTGIGVAQKGWGRYLHVDIVPPGDSKIPRPAVWSY